jgi:hypothetical protein
MSWCTAFTRPRSRKRDGKALKQLKPASKEKKKTRRGEGEVVWAAPVNVEVRSEAVTSETKKRTGTQPRGKEARRQTRQEREWKRFFGRFLLVVSEGIPTANKRQHL